MSNDFSRIKPEIIFNVDFWIYVYGEREFSFKSNEPNLKNEGKGECGRKIIRKRR